MSGWEALVDDLKVALGNLYDPLVRMPASLIRLMGLSEEDQARAREALSQAIAQLDPGADVPRDTRAWRLHELLRLRYVEHLTQEDTAHRLAITVRHLGREQTAAIELLAQSLCAVSAERSGLALPGGEHAFDAQIEAEVSALQAHSRRQTAPVVSALGRVLDLLSDWCADKNVAVNLMPGPEEALVTVHPSLLYQILVAAVSYVVRSMEKGTVDISVEDRINVVAICAMAREAELPEPEEDWVAAELIESQGGSLQLDQKPAGSELCVMLPSVRSKLVLVVDDNEDLVHFYRLCLSGTIYRMAHLAEGRRLFEVISEKEPQIIVLDLMLPDVDGWELLAQLHEHRSSRSIPVIVCSVVREEELALALGAAACVNKPVRRQQLIAALDAVSSLAPS